MVQFVSFRTMAEPAQVADIGNISELNGYAKVLRDKDYDAQLKFGIQSFDDVRTASGRLGIEFIDSSIVRLTEHSKLVIDEYVYDPNPSKSKMALKFASGTIRFVSGSLNRIDKKNISLKTPTADIAIRGTDFTVTVDELGRSLIILLPGLDGDSSGEIIVTTALGSVTLSKPYQATTTNVYESAPSTPVILDLTLDVIDNMLIVTPPKEEAILTTEEIIQTNDILDFNDLDIDYLAEDFLDNEADLEFTELDINYLDVNFLEDLLDIIDALASKEEVDRLAVTASGIDIRGTDIGQDTTTQIVTLIQGSEVKLIRNVANYAEVIIDGDDSYTVIFIQDGVSRVVTINGGSDSVIRIQQGS